MASPAVTYTFSNSTTADAGQVNTNFSDLIAGMTDGTKDFSISALTLAGSFTANANVTLGNATSDTITTTGRAASSYVPGTTASYDFGSSSLGWASLYLGRNSQTVRLIPSASASATYTMTLPPSAGTKGYIPYNSDGSSTLTWTPGQTDIHSVSSDDYTVLDTDGYRTIEVTTAASTRTITLPTAADNTDRIISIKKVDSGAGAVTVDGENSETIDGEATASLPCQYDVITLQCNGTGWNSLTPKMNRYEKKNLSGNISSTTSDVITFSGLTSGRTYRLTMTCYSTSGSSGTNNAYFTANYNGSVIAYCGTINDQTADVVSSVYSTSIIFTGTSDTDLDIDATVSGTSSVIAGGSNESYALLEELNNMVVTTAF